MNNYIEQAKNFLDQWANELDINLFIKQHNSLDYEGESPLLVDIDPYLAFCLEKATILHSQENFKSLSELQIQPDLYEIDENNHKFSVNGYWVTKVYRNTEPNMDRNATDVWLNLSLDLETNDSSNLCASTSNATGLLIVKNGFSLCENATYDAAA